MEIIYQKTEFYIYMQYTPVHFAISLIVLLFNVYVRLLFFLFTTEQFLNIVTLKTLNRRWILLLKLARNKTFLDFYLLIFHVQ